LIVDAHVHLGKCRETRINGNADFLIKTADKLGIDKLCVSSLRGLQYDFHKGNMEVAEAMKRYPTRIFGYVNVNPYFDEEAVREVRKYVKDYGMIGVKLHTVEGMWRGDDPCLNPIFEEAIKLGVPIKIHAEADDSDTMADRFPDATIIMCHMGGGGDWLKGIRTARRRNNIILDTASTCMDVGMVEEAIKAAGSERVVYGSDFPLLNPVTQLAKVKMADIDEESKRLILGENIVRILRLER
jgi:hypothetical protein